MSLNPDDEAALLHTLETRRMLLEEAPPEALRAVLRHFQQVAPPGAPIRDIRRLERFVQIWDHPVVNENFTTDKAIGVCLARSIASSGSPHAGWARGLLSDDEAILQDPTVPRRLRLRSALRVDGSTDLQARIEILRALEEGDPAVTHTVQAFEAAVLLRNGALEAGVQRIQPLWDPAVPRLTPLDSLSGGRIETYLNVLLMHPERARPFALSLLEGVEAPASPTLEAELQAAVQLPEAQLAERIALLSGQAPRTTATLCDRVLAIRPSPIALHARVSPAFRERRWQDAIDVLERHDEAFDDELVTAILVGTRAASDAYAGRLDAARAPFDQSAPLLRAATDRTDPLHDLADYLLWLLEEVEWEPPAEEAPHPIVPVRPLRTGGFHPDPETSEFSPGLFHAIDSLDLPPEAKEALAAAGFEQVYQLVEISETAIARSPLAPWLDEMRQQLGERHLSFSMQLAAEFEKEGGPPRRP